MQEPEVEFRLGVALVWASTYAAGRAYSRTLQVRVIFGVDDTRLHLTTPTTTRPVGTGTIGVVNGSRMGRRTTVYGGTDGGMQ